MNPEWLALVNELALVAFVLGGFVSMSLGIIVASVVGR